MRTRKVLCALIGVLGTLAMALGPAAPAFAAASPQNGVYFDASHPEFLKLGNALLPEALGFTDGWWSAGGWQPYPQVVRR